jgi:hypothetical protein
MLRERGTDPAEPGRTGRVYPEKNLWLLRLSSLLASTLQGSFAARLGPLHQCYLSIYYLKKPNLPIDAINRLIASTVALEKLFCWTTA